MTDYIKICILFSNIYVTNKNVVRRLLLFSLTIAVYVFCTGCKKYLDKKSDQSLSVPSGLADLQGMLDEPRLNTAMDLINTGTDEYYVTPDDWASETELNMNAYLWDGNVNDLEDWRRQYITIFTANTALDNLQNVSTTGKDDIADNVKGTALFLRAHSFYQLTQLFALQYDGNTAAQDLGIPLRLNSNFNVPSVRSTVEQTYARIIQDLEDALPLLPVVPVVKTRPSKPACFALLARAYLQMGDFTRAKENAEKCLNLHNELLDFNNQQEVDSLSTMPISRFNKEVIFFTNTGACLNASTKAKIDSNLYKSYHNDDLRKKVFFSDNGDHTYRFIGSYNGGAEELFNGLASDEVLLIKAECDARLGNIDAAMTALNLLLEKRWRATTFIPFSASSATDALQKVLAERKKELIYRGTRWPDIKRLNKEPSFALTLNRNLNGQVYELKPNDKRFALLIPQEIIQLTTMPQNER